jgi:hypothetical protein
LNGGATNAQVRDLYKREQEEKRMKEEEMTLRRSKNRRRATSTGLRSILG